MNRRDFLTATAAISLAVPLSPGKARAAAAAEYTPGLVDSELAAGKTLFVDFHATWCSTCAAQNRVIDALKAANPAYEAQITFIRVDWDMFAEDALTKRLAIPRRSTLVVLKGDQELGRIVAGTAKADIQALMDQALTAASA